MRSKDILNINVDLEKGEYVLSRYDGEQTIVIPINNGEEREYKKAHIDARRKEIIGTKYVPKEREKQIDVGLYDALSEFDKKYGTEFAKKYFEITIEQIPYTGLSEKARDRKIRANISKMSKFIEARMNINYNLNIFNMSKKLSIFDRLQAIRVALAQKVNGIQVNLNKPKRTPNILPEYTEDLSKEEQEIDEIIQSIRTEREETFARTEPEETNTIIEPENQTAEQHSPEAERVTEPEVVEQKIEDSSNREPIIIDGNEEDLSLIKVGTAMQIDSGKYFQSANETGLYGHFEKLQNVKKEISKIVIITKKGELILADKNESLYELKQKYPEATFSYQFSCRYQDNSTSILGWTTDISKAKVEKQEQTPIIEQTTEESAEQSESPKVQYEQKTKKELSRVKSRQAYKKAAREAKKMKNIYQTKQKDTTRPVKTQEQIQAEARARKQAKAQKNAEAMRVARQQAAEQKKLKEEQERAEQERIAKEEQAKKDARLSSRVKRIILGKKDAEIQEEHIVKRFTRKLKDQRDSIRNKVHIPKANKRTLAGAVGAVCIVAAIGLSIAGFGNNGTSKTEVNQPTIESTYNVSTETAAPSESQSSEEKDYTEAIKQAIRFEENDKIQAGASITEETVTKTEESTPVIEENTEKTEETATSVEENTEKDVEDATVTDSSIDYLSSVKVGATMNIEEGKYFECPDGTGDFGYFENQPDGTKEISIIGITTSKGYFSTTDTSMNLYELKQMFPDAKFSYHFICRYEDGSTKTLGWLTENSIEQNLENTRQSSIDEGR